MKTWHGDEDAFNKLIDLLDKAVDRSLALPLACPVCHADRPTFHAYFHVFSPHSRRGGIWAWCSNCRSLAHLSGNIPEWWSNYPGISTHKLTRVPEYLETLATQLDVHWNEQVLKKPKRDWIFRVFVDATQERPGGIVAVAGARPEGEKRPPVGAIVSVEAAGRPHRSAVLVAYERELRGRGIAFLLSGIDRADIPSGAYVIWKPGGHGSATPPEVASE